MTDGWKISTQNADEDFMLSDQSTAGVECRSDNLSKPSYCGLNRDTQSINLGILFGVRLSTGIATVSSRPLG
jgi:hypothetical protein